MLYRQLSMFVTLYRLSMFVKLYRQQCLLELDVSDGHCQWIKLYRQRNNVCYALPSTSVFIILYGHCQCLLRSTVKHNKHCYALTVNVNVCLLSKHSTVNVKHC